MLQDNDAKLEDEAAAFFDSLPTAAATVETGIDCCEKKGQQIYSLAHSAILDTLSAVNSHLGSVTDAAARGQSLVDKIIEKVNKESISRGLLLQQLREECNSDIDKGLQADATSMHQVSEGIEVGHEVVRDCECHCTGLMQELIGNVRLIVNEKLQWDDGAPRLPEKCQGDLPSRDSIYQLQAPSREVLLQEFGQKDRTGGLRPQYAKFTTEQATGKWSHGIVLKQVQSTAPQSASRPASPVQESKTKIPMFGASRLPALQTVDRKPVEQSALVTVPLVPGIKTKIPRKVGPIVDAGLENIDKGM